MAYSTSFASMGIAVGSNIFSTYSTGENRVTASILAVIQSLSLSRIERLLGALMEESEFELVRFQNQPASGGSGVPDAVILTSCRLLIETKTSRNAVRSEQLRRHLDRLDKESESMQRLLVLTPDDSRPEQISKTNDKRLVWSSFAAFDQAIDELLSDKNEVVSEREAFLLRELQSMFVAEKLVGSSSDVVVVPAREAWREYNEVHAYVCQPNRTFQPVGRIAFYAEGQIHPLIPKILESHESVLFERGLHRGRLGLLVEQLLKSEWRENGANYKVLLLSPPDDINTVRLDKAIPNDLTSESGRVTAFTQNQRYVTLERLRSAQRTSDLVDAG